MERKELETYQVQLSQVELALVSEPDNTDLSSLRSELKELIALTEQSIAQSEAAAATAAASSSRKTHTTTTPSASTPPATLFQAGDEVLARYSGDNAWYPARITSVGGSEQNRQFSVVFKGYNSTELLQSASLKPLPAGYQASAASGGGTNGKRKAGDDFDGPGTGNGGKDEKERKKKKNEKKAEVRAEKAKEQTSKQNTWLKFAKKSEKKGTPIAGLAGTSIFKTPDNPHGRVGVTGSGQGMTEYGTRNKHKFSTDP